MIAKGLVIGTQYAFGGDHRNQIEIINKTYSILNPVGGWFDSGGFDGDVNPIKANSTTTLYASKSSFSTCGCSGYVQFEID